MKTASIIMLLFSTTGAGFLLSEKAKKRKEICRELIILCDMLLLDISFRSTPITELIEKFDYKYLDFLTLDKIRKRGKIDSVLSDDECSELSDFLYQIGKSDVQNQIRLIEGYRENVKHMYEKYNALYVKNSKIYLSFGFFGGAVISIFML